MMIESFAWLLRAEISSSRLLFPYKDISIASSRRKDEVLDSWRSWWIEQRSFLSYYSHSTLSTPKKMHPALFLLRKRFRQSICNSSRQLHTAYKVAVTWTPSSADLWEPEICFSCWYYQPRDSSDSVRLQLHRMMELKSEICVLSELQFF